ncbi:hypothetical protein BJY14_007846 [Actinomadura luteofluorescens]|uniref:NERD domain-containing protein n=1 Tax=Actinomadura luteofluorescens TaxID=46163 RepID=A0A7Y9JKU0_9ACTN|nr:hypothetical protein [Actinomadura luteofluorescens]NYD51863.1 hypothetical protein [Actinomadura luteofluorescens]
MAELTDKSIPGPRGYFPRNGPPGMIPLMAKNDMSAGAEAWFDTYLTELGYTWQVEPDVGLNSKIKNPDRLVAADGIQIVCEVKSFNTPGLFAPEEFHRSADGNGWAGPRSRSMREALKPLRSQIKQAAPQLKAAQHLGTPWSLSWPTR